MQTGLSKDRKLDGVMEDWNGFAFDPHISYTDGKEFGEPQ